jgi:hypothetical protein
VLDCRRTVQPEKTFSCFGRVTRPALAGVLALILLFVAVLSASPSLHRYFHHNSAVGDHLCLVCAFANGQVNTAEVASAAALIFLSFVCGICAVQTTPLPSFDYRLSPSRAPPVS